MSPGISRREWFAVVALLVLAFLLRTVALTQVPPGLHNDEVIEIKMTESVAGGRLAIFFPEDIGSEGLYFYFAAPLMRVLGYHLPAVRWPAIILSMISMCVIWALHRRLFGPVVALTALAGFAIVFWTVAFGRIVSHVVILVPVGALAAYFFWRAWSEATPLSRANTLHESSESVAKRRRIRAWSLWACSGLCLGLAINGYTAARVLPAILIVFAVYVLLFQRPSWRRWWTGIAIALAVAAITALPLAVYLVRNPGVDQLDFHDIDRPFIELRQGNPGPAISTTLKTLGMFAFLGDPLAYYDLPGRPVFEPIGALLLAAGLVIALTRWRRPEYAFILLWFFVSLVPGMLSQPAPNYTRTLGVQVVLFAFPGIAVAALLQNQGRILGKNTRVWTYALLIALFFGNLAWTARDYFFVWPSVDVVRFWHQSALKTVADRLQADADTSPVAVCVPDRLITERDPWWKPAWQHMRYLLDRRELALRYYDCSNATVLLDGPARYAFPDESEVDALQRFPGYAFWATGKPEVEFLADGPALVLHSETALATYLTEMVGDGAVAWAPEVGSVGAPARLPLDFQGVVEFLGYELPDTPLKPGDTFDLVTYWRVTGPLMPGLLQFTHVLNAENSIVSQQDRLALTSASLQPGDGLLQIHRSTLPGDLAAGEYPVTIGLYTPSDGRRLGIIQRGEPRGDRLWLRSILVEN